MTELKPFKIEQEFKCVKDLYGYLFKNVDLLTELTGIQIQKPLKKQPFCLTGKELITERKILFFATKSDIPEDLGELLTLAGVLKPDIVVFFLNKATVIYNDTFQWLQSICNVDAQFMVAEVTF